MSCRSFVSSQSGHRCFSIVELVLVMSLALLIFAMTLPSLKGVLRSNQVNVGSSMLAQEVRLARQRAIASGKFVAVLLPTAEIDDEGGFSDPEYKANSYRSCYLTGEPVLQLKDGDAWYEGTFDRYIENSSWRFLPANVYIGYTESFGPFSTAVNVTTVTVVGDAFSINNAALPPRSCNVVSDLLFPETTNVDVIDNVRSLIFRPDGSVLPAPAKGPGSPLDTLIVVQGGQIRNGTTLLLEGDVSRNLVAFEINRFTGKLQFH